MARGISIEIIIASNPHDDVKAAFAEMGIDYSVKTEGRLCAAVIDEETVWYGTIPLLAFPKKEDCSIRFKSSEVAAELLEEIQQRGELGPQQRTGHPHQLRWNRDRFWLINRKSIPIPPQLRSRWLAQRTLKQLLMRAHSDQSNHRVSLMRQVENDHVDQAVG